MAEFSVFYHPAGKLRYTGEDRSYLSVKPVWASPLSHPGKYLALVDGKGKQIVMINDVAALADDTRKLLEEELRRRYLTPQVTKVVELRYELGVTYWSVETDRGDREFVTQSLHENAQWLGEQHLLIIDVDGNRFEIPDIDALDKRSQTLIANST